MKKTLLSISLVTGILPISASDQSSLENSALKKMSDRIDSISKVTDLIKPSRTAIYEKREKLKSHLPLLEKHHKNLCRLLFLFNKAIYKGSILNDEECKRVRNYIELRKYLTNQHNDVNLFFLLEKTTSYLNNRLQNNFNKITKDDITSLKKTLEFFSEEEYKTFKLIQSINDGSALRSDDPCHLKALQNQHLLWLRWEKLDQNKTEPTSTSLKIGLKSNYPKTLKEVEKKVETNFLEHGRVAIPTGSSYDWLSILKATPYNLYHVKTAPKEMYLFINPEGINLREKGTTEKSIFGCEALSFIELYKQPVEDILLPQLTTATCINGQIQEISTEIDKWWHELVEYDKVTKTLKKAIIPEENNIINEKLKFCDHSLTPIENNEKSVD